MFPGYKNIIAQAFDIIDSVPGYGKTAGNLRLLSIEYLPSLPDRAHTSLRSKIIVGPEALLESQKLFSLAGTLVHEEYHTRQNPFLKTVSFWAGIAMRKPVMARYERPAYRAQIDFLRALAKARPELSEAVDAEISAILDNVHQKKNLRAEEV